MHRFLAALQGRLGQIFLSAIALLYLYFALTPFTWDPPRWAKNGAQFEDGDILVLASPGMIRSEESAPLLASAIEQNEFKLSLRLRSALPIQKGPARIFTISANPYFRNLTVGQENHDLVVRLRTPETTPNGLPPYVVHDFFDSKSQRRIDLLIDGNEVRLTLDGSEVLADSLPKDALRAWDSDFRVALGNELTWDRPWLGQIAVAVIGVGAEEFDLLRTDTMELPSGFWSGNDWRFFHPRSLFSLDYSSTDLVLNFLCFVPAGFLLVMIRSRPGSVAFALRVVAVGSFFVESVQICFAGRYPSAIDWILNVLGTGFGAWLAYSVKQRRCAGDFSPKRNY